MSAADAAMMHERGVQWRDQRKLVAHTHSEACREWEDPDGSSRPIAHEVLFSKLGYPPEQADASVERINAQRSLNAAIEASMN